MSVIRRLNDQDASSAKILLRQDLDENVMMLSGLNYYGCNSPYISYWGEFEGGHLITVAQERLGNFTLYSRDEYDAAGFAELIRREGISALMGSMGFMEPLFAHLKVQQLKRFHYCRLNPDKFYPVDDRIPLEFLDYSKHQPTLSDGLRVYRHPSNPMGVPSRFSLMQDWRIGGLELVLIRHNRIPAAVARSSYFFENRAVILGVVTAAPYRKLGYASALVSGLCRRLLDQGRIPILFYNNDAAGRIYEKLGFEQLMEDDWMMAELNLNG